MDGTLFDYDAAERYALTKAFATISIQVTDETIARYREINQALFGQLEQGAIDLPELKIKRFESLFNHLNIRADAVRFSGTYLGYLASGSQLLPGAEEAIWQLSDVVAMIILTNGISSVQRPRLEKSAIRPCFKDMIISDEVGCAKPGKEIFDITFDRMGNPPLDQVLMVGDSLTSDIAGGMSYGIDTCWIAPPQTHESESLATYRITQLYELPLILGG